MRMSKIVKAAGIGIVGGLAIGGTAFAAGTSAGSSPIPTVSSQAPPTRPLCYTLSPYGFPGGHVPVPAHSVLSASSGNSLTVAPWAEVVGGMSTSARTVRVTITDGYFIGSGGTSISVVLPAGKGDGPGIVGVPPVRSGSVGTMVVTATSPGCPTVTKTYPVEAAVVVAVSHGSGGGVPVGAAVGGGIGFLVIGMAGGFVVGKPRPAK